MNMELQKLDYRNTRSNSPYTCQRCPSRCSYLYLSVLNELIKTDCVRKIIRGLDNVFLVVDVPIEHLCDLIVSLGSLMGKIIH